MLSDPVGLGKTSTSIGVIKRYLDDAEGKKRIEIICPKSIVSQWEKELTEEGVLGYRPITLQNSNEIERKTIRNLLPQWPDFGEELSNTLSADLNQGLR